VAGGGWGLTDHLKAGQEALEEVLAGIGHGQRAELGHHDAVPLAVLAVRFAPQEATAVRHLSPLDLELVQKRHAVKPVVEAGWLGGEGETFKVTPFSCPYDTQCTPMNRPWMEGSPTLLSFSRFLPC